MYDCLENDDNDNDIGIRGGDDHGGNNGDDDRCGDLGDMMTMVMAMTMMQNAKWWSWLSSS